MMTEIDPAHVDTEQGNNTPGNNPQKEEATNRKDKKSNKSMAKEKVKGIVDIPYILSPQGILKIVELVVGIICIGCTGAVANDAHIFFLAVAIILFLFTLVLLIFYTFRLVDRIAFTWEFAEILFGLLATLIYLVASIVLAVFAYGKAPYITGAVFGFINTLAYAASTVFSFREWQTGQEMAAAVH